MKLRKLRTTSDARPLSALYVINDLLDLLHVRRSRFQQDLSGFGIVQDCSQRLLISCAIPAAISPAVERRLTCASSTIRCRDSISAE